MNQCQRLDKKFVKLSLYIEEEEFISEKHENENTTGLRRNNDSSYFYTIFYSICQRLLLSEG